MSKPNRCSYEKIMILLVSSITILLFFILITMISNAYVYLHYSNNIKEIINNVDDSMTNIDDSLTNIDYSLRELELIE